MDYLTFRRKALQALTLIKCKTQWKSKDEVENWIRNEYNRHYGKEGA